MLSDPAECIINAVVTAMREAFTADSSAPPLGGGSDRVRFFAGDSAPLDFFDAHLNDPDCGCEKPFIWVRLMRRYRSQTFPAPWVGEAPCDQPHVVAVEIGVGRCSSMLTTECDWSAYEAEAEVSMDDSNRIEIALCRARQLMQRTKCSDAVAFDAVVPYGPVGGVLAWVSVLYARVDSPA